MATPQKRRTQRVGKKNTRKNANKHLKKVVIKSNKIIRDNWDKKQTLKQNYERLGLLTSLNGVSGGREKLVPPKKEEAMDTEEGEELKELTEEEIEKVKKSLRPGEGLIQRDDEGNVIRVIVGERKTHDEILDEEFPVVEAKTDVVRELEARAACAIKRERHQTEYEKDWIAQLIAKHGDDYEAMFWDKKLNIYQQTANQLKRKCEKYKKDH
ncbi:Nucleolar protein 16 [Apophysomyces ossiformis]|uniref:Nucleolar protein 16 n=1 Tax=Apophysomyces ossiformis TaxID=679940 RepID=A0A8H7BLW5_9FUNG|nr:Nucleolar protein 16 [Apophysomyces ossiformis]